MRKQSCASLGGETIGGGQRNRFDESLYSAAMCSSSRHKDPRQVVGYAPRASSSAPLCRDQGHSRIGSDQTTETAGNAAGIDVQHDEFTSLLHLDHTLNRCLVHKTKRAFFSTMRNVFFRESGTELFVGRRFLTRRNRYNRGGQDEMDSSWSWTNRHDQSYYTFDYRDLHARARFSRIEFQRVRLFHPSVTDGAGTDRSRSERSIPGALTVPATV